MASFELAVSKTIAVEGGLVDDPNDYGGLTKYGISKRAYPELDIINLTIEDAKKIYKRDYWDKMLLDKVSNQKIAEELFDTGVNAYWITAVKFLQRVLNILTDADLKVDGLMGAKTLNVLNTYKHEKAILIALNGIQFMHYLNIVDAKPSQKVFFRGWIEKRVNLGE